MITFSYQKVQNTQQKYMQDMPIFRFSMKETVTKENDRPEPHRITNLDCRQTSIEQETSNFEVRYSPLDI